MASSAQLAQRGAKRSIIGLLIADDSAMNCQLLKSAVALRPSFRVVACAVSREEVAGIAVL